jgi:transposase
MKHWNMAQWVNLFTRYQLCHFLGALLILYPLLEELEVAEIINKYCPTEAEVEHGTVVVVLALNRLTAPRPLYKVADWMAYSILPKVLGMPARKFNDDRLGRALDAIAPHLQEIWLEIASRALEHYAIDLSIIFYDLTAFVMEGTYEESSLADFGFAHNTPLDKRKIKLAANATQDGGIPLSWAAICGRTADTATVEENLRRLSRILRRQDWSEEGALMVGDRAMLNSRLAIVYDEHKESGLRYLAGLEPRTNAHKDLLSQVPLKDLRDNYLLGEPGHRYWGVRRPITFTYEDEESEEKRSATHTALVVLSEATRRQWRRTRFEQLRDLGTCLQEEVEDKLNRPYWRNPETIRQRVQSRLDDSPVGSVVKVDVWGAYGEVEMRWQVDRDALRDLCRSDGRYLLVTNDPTLSPVEMLQIYKDKDRVEKRFRVTKQDLRVRPIYLHKDERIEAMLMVNMIALLVYSLAERRCRRNGLQITSRHLIYEFQSLHVVETHCWDGSVLYRCMPLTDHQREIVQQIGLAGKTLLDTDGWQTDEVLGTRLTFPPPREYSLLEGGPAA